MLYAPILESNIPAFTQYLIKIPFTMNPAVSVNEFQYFAVQIKTMTGTIILRDIIGKDVSLINKNNTNIANIDINYLFGIENLIGTPGNLVNGQYYKIQLGFVKEQDVVYPDATNNFTALYVNFDNIKFSDIAIGRCIEAPEIKINNWDHATSHYDTMFYKGQTVQFTHSETVSQYRFILNEVSTHTILQDTGWLTHDSSTDIFKEITEEDGTKKTIRETTDEFELLYELGTIYYKIAYYVKTNNGYETQVEYYITGKGNDNPLSNIEFTAIHDGIDYGLGHENGFIILSIRETENFSDSIAGDYKIRRFSNSKNMWENIFNFSLGEIIDDRTQDTWLDLAIEQGETYEYKLVKYFKDGNDINYMYSQPIRIKADYEDIFLSDGERQLCIKYNPKVSSFKETIQEAKQDTLGGKYPFFFRNGNLGYKEIPLNGLLSFNLDNIEMFISRAQLGIPTEELPSINIDGDNFNAERKFKLEVMNWLNNGKPKLFRSPAEGMYVVRLMNVSLSPQDALSRMLHSFSATAYEIAPTDYSTLMKHKLIFNNKEVIENVKLSITDSQLWPEY